MKENIETFKAPTGTKDILPAEAAVWLSVEEKCRDIFDLYGYKPIRTPILEHSGLFNRSLGEETEIVKKQMFLIPRQTEIFCLRPEATAAVVRAYLENNLDKTDGFMKLYYMGPMFRAERPQKGRLRQFHHIGIEAIGSSNPYVDSEIIALARGILEELKISGYQIKINSLGCPEDKQTLNRLLREKLKDKLEKLCEDCNDRFNRNVFRILDCKNDGCKQVVSELDLQYNEYLCQPCLQHFTIVKNNLDALKVDYHSSTSLVRGLDYYTKTVFEISHPGLGAQDALGAGGRYDTLITNLGGPHLGAMGFAFGLERLLLAAPQESGVFAENLSVFVITLGEQAQKKGFLLLQELRQARISCDMDYEDKSLKAQMRKAHDSKARFAAILGENELAKQVIALKDMRAGSQHEIAFTTIVNEIKERL
ncbi:MAG: histidine--tRNA ligase [Omnitrophica WOR_2 bacterium GWF2_43_52]|nr:MAG: histidine--tRNA ligase [Omnitrophica WOR_2 bacterium GWA2_44_7]OGX14981.1 MAG: histidine--tRNA ligase [Omnitrophica WOR_2 bacterium GWC2_44_8]OGX22472.1 MAG: histidine--tRNA ligase [Omnitrophica WOR_2 bacterium GWF2_43_52]HAH21527.1 histidine--tRNA ligase [Candidatus Omnitrophota bacterium]HBG64559.1 histidine--tRNA ligase [Candidatus Omnitrophota bacterium]